MSSALPSATGPVVGEGTFRYQVQLGWEQLPSGWSFAEAVGVATDAAANVYVFNRGEHPLIVFDRQGRFLRSWGEGAFARPHGITIAPDDSLYLVDDLGHVVRKYSPEGKLLATIGTPGEASDTGAEGFDYRTIRRPAGPFNCPTNLAIAPTGELFVSDGYGNARVHRFSPEGEWLASWGEPGAGPGQFHVPHGIAVAADGTVIVADRENSRLQFFTPAGKFVGQWTEIARPCDLAIDPAGNLIVAELGYRAGMFEGNVAGSGQTAGGRVCVYSPAGQRLATLGGGDRPCAAGDFFATHDVAIDPFGDLYVGEVTLSAGGNRGLVPRDCHTLQKFVRTAAQETA
jgi:DNA-binding beta-propeller fold protein YncE